MISREDTVSHVSRMSKVLWGEGLFLRPQHFQRQDTYHEARLHHVAQSLHPYPWGIRQIRLDPRALESGAVRILELSLVFPDGEIYQAPDADTLPDPLRLEELPAGVSSTVIHLALPLLKEHGGNCDDDDGNARFTQTLMGTSDLYTDSAQAELTYLKKSVRLLTDDTPRDRYLTVPLLRVKRTSTGGFELDDTFMPPCLHLDASEYLTRQLRGLLDALQAKSEALGNQQRQASQGLIEFRSSDVASFWLLHTANTAYATLSHFFAQPRFHPERLYQELLRLAGNLLTYSTQHGLADLPQYRHDAPDEAFAALFHLVRDLLDTVISTRHFAIPLAEIKPSYHRGMLDSQRIDAQTALYLGVAADMPGQELVETVPVRFKVGAPDDVEKCVLAAMPGVKLIHANQIPAAIPVRPGSYYFSLEPRGPLYERMLKGQSVMVYVPTGVQDLKLELIAVTS